MSMMCQVVSTPAHNFSIHIAGFYSCPVSAGKVKTLSPPSYLRLFLSGQRPAPYGRGFVRIDRVALKRLRSNAALLVCRAGSNYNATCYHFGPVTRQMTRFKTTVRLENYQLERRGSESTSLSKVG